MSEKQNLLGLEIAQWFRALADGPKDLVSFNSPCMQVPNHLWLKSQGDQTTSSEFCGYCMHVQYWLHKHTLRHSYI